MVVSHTLCNPIGLSFGGSHVGYTRRRTPPIRRLHAPMCRWHERRRTPPIGGLHAPMCWWHKRRTPPIGGLHTPMCRWRKGRRTPPIGGLHAPMCWWHERRTPPIRGLHTRLGDMKGREPPQSGGYTFPCVGDMRGEPPQSGGYTLLCSSACIYRRWLVKQKDKKTHRESNSPGWEVARSRASVVQADARSALAGACGKQMVVFVHVIVLHFRIGFTNFIVAHSILVRFVWFLVRSNAVSIHKTTQIF